MIYHRQISLSLALIVCIAFAVAQANMSLSAQSPIPEPSMTLDPGTPSTNTILVNAYIGNDSRHWHEQVSANPQFANPALGFSTYLGGNQNDEGWAIVLDRDKNIYVAGNSSSDRLAGFSTSKPTDTYQDVFVAKLTPDGQSLIYVTYLAGNENEECNGMTVDQAGNVYITGETWSVTFPTLGAFQNYLASASDAWVAKLDPSGRLVFSTYLGGNNGDEAYEVKVDPAGYVYVTGETYSADFPVLNALQADHRGSEDIFITKLVPDGSALAYSTFIGDSNHDEGVRLVLDAAGDIYVAGESWSPDFPITANAPQRSFGGGWRDVVVLKLSADGQHLIYSTFLGGAGNEEGYGLAVDEDGNAYVAGYTNSTNLPVVNAFQSTYGGGADDEFDAFVAKLNASGTAWIYSTYLGGMGNDKSWWLAINSKREAFVAGYTGSYNFPTTLDGWQTRYNGGWTDAFITGLNAAGNGLVYSSYLGGLGDDEGWAIALDDSDSVYVTGSSPSNDFPLASPLQAANAGQADAFVAKITFATPTPTPTSTPTSTRTPTPTPTPPPSSQLIGAEGGILWHAYPGHLTMLHFPPLTVKTPTRFTLSYNQRSNVQGELEGIDHFFSLYTTSALPLFNKPVSVTLAYATHASAIQGSLRLYRLEGAKWVTDSITSTGAISNAIFAQIDRPGAYGLLGNTHRCYLPIVLRSP